MKKQTLILLSSALLFGAAAAAPAAPYFVTANLGLLGANPGQTNTFLYGKSQLPYTFAASSSSSSKLAYGVGFGYRFSIAENFKTNISLNYLHTDGYNVKGNVNDMSSTLYRYSYQTQSNAFLLRDDFVYSSNNANSTWYTLNPYLGVTVGYASNKSNNYKDTAKVGGQKFPGKTTSSFAWGIDGGLAYHLGQSNTIALEAQYLNLGKTSLGAYEGKTLKGKNLKGVKISLAYTYFFNM